MAEGMILLVYEKTHEHGENKNTQACEFSKLKFEKLQIRHSKQIRFRHSKSKCSNPI